MAYGHRAEKETKNRHIRNLVLPVLFVLACFCALFCPFSAVKPPVCRAKNAFFLGNCRILWKKWRKKVALPPSQGGSRRARWRLSMCGWISRGISPPLPGMPGGLRPTRPHALRASALLLAPPSARRPKAVTPSRAHRRRPSAADRCLSLPPVAALCALCSPPLSPGFCARGR